MKNKYLKEQKEKILAFAREQYKKGEITKEQLKKVYYYNFIKNV
jgi:uncharacterized membrane protein